MVQYGMAPNVIFRQNCQASTPCSASNSTARSFHCSPPSMSLHLHCLSKAPCWSPSPKDSVELESRLAQSRFQCSLAIVMMTSLSCCIAPLHSSSQRDNLAFSGRIKSTITAASCPERHAVKYLQNIIISPPHLLFRNLGKKNIFAKNIHFWLSIERRSIYKCSSCITFLCLLKYWNVFYPKWVFI